VDVGAEHGHHGVQLTVAGERIVPVPDDSDTNGHHERGSSTA